MLGNRVRVTLLPALAAPVNEQCKSIYHLEHVSSSGSDDRSPAVVFCEKLASFGVAERSRPANGVVAVRSQGYPSLSNDRRRSSRQENDHADEVRY